MALAGPVSPTHKGRRDPKSPFPPDATLYIKVNEEKLTADSIQVIPPDQTSSNLESLDAFKATKEQIFAFEARSMTASLALCVACLEKMDEAVETELSSHEQWKLGVRKLLPELVQAYHDSKALCDLTDG